MQNGAQTITVSATRTLGGQSGDSNGDGTLDVLDIVYFIDVILNP